MLFGNGVFADEIKLKILKWDHPGLTQVALHPATSVLRRQRIEDTDSQRRGEIETEAEMRMMRLQAKEHLKPLEAERGKERFSPRATGGCEALLMHAFVLDFGTPKLGENTFLLL